MSLGQIIRDRREELRFTLDEVAAKTGFSKPYLSTVETAKVKNPPSDTLLSKLESVLDFESYSIETFARSQKHHSGSQQGDARAYQFDDLSATEFVAWWLWPNFAFQSYPGGRAHLWKWTPVDVAHTHLTVDWYFPNKDLAEWESELIRHHAATTFQEDQNIIASVQLGLGSRACQPGPLMIDDAKSVLSEHAVAAIQQLWRDAMGVEYE